MDPWQRSISQESDRALAQGVAIISLAAAGFALGLGTLAYFVWWARQ